MAKVVYEPDYHLIEIDCGVAKEGEVYANFLPKHRKQVEAALKECGLKLMDIQPILVAASCDIEITTADIKHLIDHPDEPILMNGGPFGIYMSLTKTPMDFLEENPITPQGTNL